MERDVSGKIIVIFLKTVSSEEAEKIISGHGLSVLNTSKHYVLVEVPRGHEGEWVARFNEMPEVRVAERVVLHDTCAGTDG